jgi:ABC-type cobalamin/Fe3+-siderophores transport system ATPase subunit
VLVWPHDYMTEREDLAIPLNECGSGVGQVLAILYVLLTSDQPQVIIVDEPQSFLHPGAVRKLIEVLKRYPKHQYIFATHSPTVIAAANPATLIMVRATAGESVLEAMDTRDANHLQSYLSEIGARLSDVFGADSTLWVEGQTEEACFPLILRESHRSLMGTAIVGIRQTGDMQTRDRMKVLEMYRKLSEAKTLLPPAIAFVFDQECMSLEEREDLERMRLVTVRLLPRRMYENYLLEADAVAAVMNDIENFRKQPISGEEVLVLFESKSREAKEKGRQLRYFCPKVARVPEDWTRRIDAANLLADVFAELSEHRVTYQKVTHGIAITTWLLERRPQAFDEIVDLLAPLLPSS